MCLSVLSDARLYDALLKFDEELAAQARALGCPCGGPLHRGDYGRKPRGALVPLPDGYDQRFSLCCGRRDCRHRVTPPSLRYLGRKVYLAVVVVLVTAMRHGVTDARAAAVRRAVGASRETLARWRQWWTTQFAMTPFWKRARALLHAPVAIAELPASLLARFAGSCELDCVVKLLAFIKPVTTASAAHLEGISMGE
jgi:hypothetical protein